MVLNRRGIYHPQYTQKIARVDEGGMTAAITVLRRNPAVTSSADDWNYDLGEPNTESEFMPICRTQARVTAQSTWSASGYLMGDQTTVYQAVKFNLPFARRDWLLEGEAPEFRTEDRIIIDDVFFPHLTPLLPFVYTVRNMLISDTDAQWTLVTDVNLKTRRPS